MIAKGFIPGVGTRSFAIMKSFRRREDFHDRGQLQKT
jgi:hypothetical protein